MFFISHRTHKSEYRLEAFINLKVARTSILETEEFDASANIQAQIHSILVKKKI
jgi:hypothetical protein